MWPSIIAAARAACSPSRFGRVESEAISSSIGRLRRTGQTRRSTTSVAGARLIDDDAQQLQGNLGAEAVEFLGGRADRVARPAGAAGMAVGEAAVALTDSRRIRHRKLLDTKIACRIRVAPPATYSGQWPRIKSVFHRGRIPFHCP